jgi:hypothetical protein
MFAIGPGFATQTIFRIGKETDNCSWLYVFVSALFEKEILDVRKVSAKLFFKCQLLPPQYG